MAAGTVHGALPLFIRFIGTGPVLRDTVTLDQRVSWVDRTPVVAKVSVLVGQHDDVVCTVQALFYMCSSQSAGYNDICNMLGGPAI